MNDEQAAAYLKRIAYAGPMAADSETLRALHRAHLLAVPFENLDIGLGRPIVLEEERLFDKIVTRRRGGFCYELNGLFAALLRALGFDVALLNGRVATGEGGFGIEFDHLALKVQLAEAWLGDVGFGDLFSDPLRLDAAGEQARDGLMYRVERDPDGAVLLRTEDGAWKAQYRFALKPYRLADFAGGCHYHQTSPHSTFTQRRVCTLATPGGRITLSDRKLVETGGTRRERLLASEAEVQAALREHFGIDLE